jgi:hypothetical protein
MALTNLPGPFDYNSTRNKLLLTEYGRNVQNMVKYIVALPTKEERNKYAQVVIDLMGFSEPAPAGCSRLLNINFGITCTSYPIFSWMLIRRIQNQVRRLST